MNTQKFRRALRLKWLEHYRENQGWIDSLGIWVTVQGQRRPSASFILATLVMLEPKLTKLMPLVVDLSNDPDRIVAALGLNFNPREELAALTHKQVKSAESPRQLPGGLTTERRSLNGPGAVPVPREPLPRDEGSGVVRGQPSAPSNL